MLGQTVIAGKAIPRHVLKTCLHFCRKKLSQDEPREDKAQRRSLVKFSRKVNKIKCQLESFKWENDQKLFISNCFVCNLFCGIVISKTISSYNIVAAKKNFLDSASKRDLWNSDAGEEKRELWKMKETKARGWVKDWEKRRVRQKKYKEKKSENNVM